MGFHVPRQKQAWFLDEALDVKRDILTLPLPDPNDDSPEAIRMRALIFAAADSTIEQSIRLRTNLLTPSAADDDMEKIFEERQRKAVLEIERLRAGEDPGYGVKPRKH